MPGISYRADIDAIEQLKIIIDGAQSFGSTYKGK
jgi:dTDP-4-amino-4,6-dideoxygalactose transaminase